MLDTKNRCTCGKSDLTGNTVNCQIIFARIVDWFEVRINWVLHNGNIGLWRIDNIIWTIKDRLGALGAHSNAKAFGWALILIGCLIGPRYLLKKMKIKTTNCVRQVNFLLISQNSFQNWSQNLPFPFVQISAAYIVLKEHFSRHVIETLRLIA